MSLSETVRGKDVMMQVNTLKSLLRFLFDQILRFRL